MANVTDGERLLLNIKDTRSETGEPRFCARAALVVVSSSTRGTAEYLEVAGLSLSCFRRFQALRALLKYIIPRKMRAIRTIAEKTEPAAMALLSSFPFELGFPDALVAAGAVEEVVDVVDVVVAAAVVLRVSEVVVVVVVSEAVDVVDAVFDVGSAVLSVVVVGPAVTSDSVIVIVTASVVLSASESLVTAGSFFAVTLVLEPCSPPLSPSESDGKSSPSSSLSSSSLPDLSCMLLLPSTAPHRPLFSLSLSL